MAREPLFSRQTTAIATLVTVCLALVGLWLLGFGVIEGQGAAAIIVIVLTFVTVVEFIRLRFRLSLRLFLLGITGLAMMMALFGTRLIEARQQRIAASEIMQLGGRLAYNIRQESAGWTATQSGLVWPDWLKQAVGEDLLLRVSWVSLGSRFQDADLHRLGDGLRYVVHLDISQSHVTDVGLAGVLPFDRLTMVTVSGRQATSAGVEQLAKLPTLQWIGLDGPTVTDATLINLQRLPQLQTILLSKTSVTQAGVEKLRQALPDSMIYVR